MFGLGFLNTVFFFALGATALPVVIHILNRRRIRKVRFSSLEFIDELNRRRMSKINLRRWIVLLLRTLAVAFLVLAFARPTLRSSAGFLVPGGAPKHVVICLDASYSMGVEREEGTVFTLAQDIAERVVDQCEDRDVVNVVSFSTRPSVLFETGTRNRQVVKTAIKEVHVTAEGTSVPAAIEAAVELIRGGEVTTGEIYLVSDFREPGDSIRGADLPDHTKLILVPVYREAIDNVSIDRIFTPRKLVRPGETVRIGVAVTNHSREHAAEFPLELSVDGKRKAERLVTLSPASSATETFVVSMNHWGGYRGRVAKNRDRLSLDDDRYFVLEISEQIPVALVRGRKWVQDADSDAPAAYFYIDKALNPRGVAEGEFDVEVVDQNVLAVSNLPDRGVVVWANPEGVDERRLELVTQYVERGGALFVFLDDGPRALWRNDRFRRYIGVDRAVAKQRPDGVRLVSFAGDHPILGIFTGEELELLSQSRITRYVAGSGVPADSVLAHFDGGGPAVWECRRGRGRILVVAASSDLASGNLPLSPMFLPFLHSAVSYLASVDRTDTRQENLVGGDLLFDLPPKWRVQTVDLRVRAPSGQEITPLFTKPSEGEVKARVPSPLEVGFYTLLGDTTRIAEASVNVDTRESNLNPSTLDPTTMGEAAVVEATVNLARDIRRERQGREIFAVFFLLAVLALAAEVYIGRRA